jgi:MFS family permease
LLPLVAKYLIYGGPQAYGILMASIGVGAVAGALVLPTLRKLVSRDVLVAGATLVYAFCLFALASFERLWPLSAVMALSGAAWITVLSSLQVAAQMALPNWVRARGLAVFMSVFMGSMALGSLFWGKLAALYSIEQSLGFAAVGAVLSVFVMRRWSIDSLDDMDLSPSMHWPSAPVVEGPDRGPVLITIEYVVRADAVRPFLELLHVLGKHRRRDGAYSWSVFEHAEKPQHYIETFNDESWLAHLRSHERVTVEVQNLQARINACLVEHTEPEVTHYLAPERSKPQAKSKRK